MPAMECAGAPKDAQAGHVKTRKEKRPVDANNYRDRAGSYRIVHGINRSEHRITVHQIEPRGKVYKHHDARLRDDRGGRAGSGQATFRRRTALHACTQRAPTRRGVARESRRTGGGAGGGGASAERTGRGIGQCAACGMRAAPKG